MAANYDHISRLLPQETAVPVCVELIGGVEQVEVGDVTRRSRDDCSLSGQRRIFKVCFSATVALQRFLLHQIPLLTFDFGRNVICVDPPPRSRMPTVLLVLEYK